ncbi:MAG: LysR family transcriptional regulator [Gammaproteobacteria bacterium]|nr:LysR family transcriptional regulator [Gammaproteobacteria bacterium]
MNPHMQAPSLKYLRTFQVAAQRLNFTTASQELCLSASAVAQHVRKLERQLGVVLFERRAQALRLTGAGMQLLEHVDSVLNRLELITRELRSQEQRPYIKLQAPPFFAAVVLMPNIAEFCAAHPGVELRVSTPATMLAQSSWDADVAVVVGAAASLQTHAHCLFPQTYVPACAPALQRQFGLRGDDDLHHQPLLVHHYRPDLWNQWAAERGVTPLLPRSVIRFDSMAAAVAAAEQGAGLVLMSGPLAETHFTRGTLARLSAAELSLGESYYLVTPAEQEQRAATAALVRWLTMQCARIVNPRVS